MCGLDAQGTAYCWGLNDDNQCGPGCSATPTAMFTTHRFSALSAGRTHTCGLDPGGTAYCWGSNANGALGTISDLNLTFNQVAGGPFKAIRAAQDNTCALTMTGIVYCWGLDNSGVLGNAADSEPCLNGCGGQGVGGSGGVYPPAAVTAPVTGTFALTSICLTDFNACAVDTEGIGWCWGYNGDGALGVGTAGADEAAPVRFQLPSGVVVQQMVCGDPICALSTTGDVYCAGSNEYGALGLGTADTKPHASPTVIPGLPAVTDLAGDIFTLCALTFDGERYCWGYNGYGDLGDGTTTNRYSPELTP
jgi:alpha-tubulin suppressor-like RCC1 family protein